MMHLCRSFFWRDRFFKTLDYLLHSFISCSTVSLGWIISLRKAFKLIQLSWFRIKTSPMQYVNKVAFFEEKNIPRCLSAQVSNKDVTQPVGTPDVRFGRLSYHHTVYLELFCVFFFF